MKDQVNSQKVNALDELKAWNSAATENVEKKMLQRVCQKVNCRWDVC
jgi:hypothetical protein